MPSFESSLNNPRAKQKQFVPIEEFPSTYPTPEEEILAQEEGDHEEEEDMIEPASSFIPPEETGRTLYDEQVANAKAIDEVREKLRKPIKVDEELLEGPTSHADLVGEEIQDAFDKDESDKKKWFALLSRWDIRKPFRFLKNAHGPRGHQKRTQKGGDTIRYS